MGNYETPFRRMYPPLLGFPLSTTDIYKLCQNHEELITELAKSLTSTANMLPRVDIDFELFQIPDMNHKMEELYGLLIEHYVRIIEWYEKGRWSHALSSLIHPYSLRFKDLSDRIAACSRDIEKLAMALARKEIRHVHELLKEVRVEQKFADQQRLKSHELLVALRAEIQRKYDLRNNKLVDIGNC